MRRPEFAEMSAFAEVAARGSFARAATQLGMSRSRLSEVVRGLEERLGVRLLNRTTRSVALTEAGERLLARLRPLLDEFETALDSVNAFRDTPVGPLRLTVPPPAAALVIAPLMARFLAAYPGITLEVSADGTLRDIVRERFDAGVRIGERIDRDMVALRIGGEQRLSVVASPAYLAAHKPPRTPHDLQAHNCIRLRFPSGAMNPWRFEKDGKSFEVAVGGTLIVNEDGLQLRAALDGVGIGYLLSDVTATAVREGRLVSLLEDWTPRFSGFYLYYPSRRRVPAPLQAFLDFLRQPATRRGREPVRAAK